MTAAVEVAGIGLHPFGRFEGATVTEMGVAAVRQALTDAGVDRRGFQAAFCGTAYSGVAAGHRVLDAIGATGGPIVDEEAGLSPAPAYFALRAQRLMRESGVTKQHLADVVVKNRANGVNNPDAMFRKGVMAEDVLASRMICEPLHLWMLCSPNEGAAALVLRAADANKGGVRVAAAALRSHLPGNVLSEAS